jgi:deoxyribodipyrimidine photolyase-related protein
VTDILAEVNKTDAKTIGTIDAANLFWPINREQSLELDFFIDECLHLFGSYQDAMTPNEWSLYPLDCLFDEYQDDFATRGDRKSNSSLAANPDKIEYNQLEGFVRQIIGWRVHARYLLVKMPEYATMNFFNEEKLPDWFWTGKTNELFKDAINQSLCTHTVNDYWEFCAFGWVS